MKDKTRIMYTICYIIYILNILNLISFLLNQYFWLEFEYISLHLYVWWSQQNRPSQT